MSGRSDGVTVHGVSDNPRRDLADLLRDVVGGGSFSTRRTAPLGDLFIEVRGAGALRLPVTASQAKELRLLASPARYGKGEETLLDPRVRDTWEVPRSLVDIDDRRWANTLRPTLDLVRDDLGLSSTCSLDADLHSVLVYEPGQFFAAHQDSEKDDRMIGSLVVLLPSRSRGGDLVVSHRGETMTYRGSATALTFIAFYGDTRHEVLPVETGYRVALTYNLRISSDSTVAPTPAVERSTAAAALLKQNFETPSEPRWRGASEAVYLPDRLVFLLDHQYSEHSLRWPQLKGEDAARVAVLRDAAEQAGCDVALALAEVQETWDCSERAPRRGRRSWSDGDDNDRPDPDDVDALGELIDSNVEIRPVDGHSVGGRSVADAELATSTPTVNLAPYDTEYTGNMGNYGNTMDRWYRRAAIVIWPRSRAFALRAKGDPAGALDELLALSDEAPSAVEPRVAMAKILLRFWPEGVHGHDQRTLLPRTLLLAVDVDDADLATRLLAPFMLEAFTPTDAYSLLIAVDRYGRSWFESRLTTWMSRRGPIASVGMPTRSAWIEALPTFCDRLLDSDTDSLIDVKRDSARTVVAEAWGWLRREIGASSGIARPSARKATLAALGAALLAVLHAASKVDAADLRTEIIDTVCSANGDLSPLLLRAIDASAQLTPSQLARIDLGPVARHCVATLRRELSQPERDSGDWSIVELHRPECCKDCTHLAAFLTDPVQRKLVWPLAQTRRQHIHQRIDDAELPVTHETIREGSPYKLVLTKTADLVSRDAERRTNVRAALVTVEGFLEQTRDTAQA